MKKNNKKLKLFSLIFLILFCLYFQTVAYSAINSTMTIKGAAYARVDADVRITNFKLSSSSSNSTSSYEEFSVNTIASKFNLLDSSSSIVFDVEVTNYGSSDVGILQLVGTVPTGLSYEIINYNLKDKICDDTGKCNQMAVKTFQIKFMGTPGEYEVNLELDFRTYHKVTYTDITNNNYPIEVIDGAELNVDFTEPLKRIAIYQNGEKVAYYPTIYQGSNLLLASVNGNIEIKQEGPVARLVSGKINEVGSEVCIKDECFYIISNDGTTVTMLAKYNLYVGGKYENNVLTAYGDEATGLQDSSMVGLSKNAQSYNGVVAYSDGSTIYSESTIKNYVNAYSVYLLGEGVSIKDARLITVTELENLGCESSVDYTTSNTGCLNSYNWLYSSTYWTQTTYKSGYVYAVMTDGQVEAGPLGVTIDFVFGVRPVIELSIDEIYDPYVVGTEKCFGDECFYVISSTKDTVTMLAKYNLHVGYVATPVVSDVNYNVNNYNVSPLIMTSNDAYVMPLISDGPITEENQTIETIPIENPSGIQDASAKGITGDSSYIGVDKFSENSYWTYYVNGSGRVLYEKYGTTYPAYVYDTNSSLYSYIENYKIFLQNYGIAISDARLISHEELLSLGCSQSSCMSAPSWVYSNSYWTGSAFNIMYVKFVESGGVYSENVFDAPGYYGVRPVITISKSEF